MRIEDNANFCTLRGQRRERNFLHAEGQSTRRKKEINFFSHRHKVPIKKYNNLLLTSAPSASLRGIKKNAHLHIVPPEIFVLFQKTHSM